MLTKLSHIYLLLLPILMFGILLSGNAYGKRVPFLSPGKETETFPVIWKNSKHTLFKTKKTQFKPRKKKFSWVRFILGEQIAFEYVMGGGDVTTSTIENGQRLIVASGTAFQKGFRIASEPSPSFNKSSHWGWSTGFSPFLFLQSLDLSDIKQELPSSIKEDTTIIPAVVTNEMGVEVDPESPNQANFTLDTSGIDYLLSGAFRFSDLTCITLYAGVAVIEYRNSIAQYGKSSGTVSAVQLFKSMRFGFQWQTYLPWRTRYFDVLLRAGFDAQMYWEVPLSNQIEFRHPEITYNESRQAFERRRVWVEDYEMMQGTARLSLIFSF